MGLTFKTKVDWLLKFCSEYDGHEYMYDEHTKETDKFNLELKVEDEIINRLKELSFLILTGDAGDGKSRILERIREKLKQQNGSWSFVNDFSELTSKERTKVLKKLKLAIEGQGQDRLLIAANTGVFMSELLQFGEGLLRGIKQSDWGLIVDFSERNLASDEEEFMEILLRFLDCKGYEACKGCRCDNCPFQYNITNLTEESMAGNIRRKQLKEVYHTLFLKGVHITFRDLLSTLAFAVTAGKTCEEIRGYKAHQPALTDEFYYYNNIFNYKGHRDKMLLEMKKIDPARKDHKIDRGLFKQLSEMSDSFEKRKESFQRIKRYYYFEKPEVYLPDNSVERGYELLNVEYLSEYREVIKKLKTDGYLDSTDHNHQLLWKFELGINRIFNPARSDAELVLFDSPLIISPKVRIEQEAGEGVAICFCSSKYFNCWEEKVPVSDLNSFLCVSIAAGGRKDEEKTVAMKVDYELFRQVMMASDCRYDVEILNKVNDLRLKEFINKTFQNVSEGEKIRIKWLGDAKMSFESFELYPLHQTGISSLRNRGKAKRLFRIGRG